MKNSKQFCHCGREIVATYNSQKFCHSCLDHLISGSKKIGTENLETELAEDTAGFVCDLLEQEEC
jgi:hypothetical protein